MNDFIQVFIISITIIGILISIVIAWPHIKGAPWIPTRMKKVRKMLALADIKRNDVLYDLGCGDGRFVISAARKFDVRALGIEINILLYLWSKFLVLILGLRKRVKILYGNFYKYDLGEADVIICYLLQETNDKLEEKLLNELKPNSRIVSNSFTFQNLKIVNEDPEEGIYVYQR